MCADKNDATAKASAVWKRIEQWMKANVSKAKRKAWFPRGASESEIAKAEAIIGLSLPEEVRASYLIHNGSGEIGNDGFLLSLEEIQEEWSLYKELLDNGTFEDITTWIKGPVKEEWFNPKWIPLTHHDSGDCVSLDMDPAVGGVVGQVIDMPHELGSGRTVLKSSFLKWLAKFAKELESGKWVYNKEEEALEEYDAQSEAELNRGTEGMEKILSHSWNTVFWVGTSPDGKIALLHAGMKVMSVEIASRKQMKVLGNLKLNKLIEKDDVINAAVFSPDGRQLALATTADIRVWNLTGELAASFNPGEDRIADGLAFTEGGSLLIASIQDGIIIVFDVVQMSKVCEYRTQRFGKSEWGRYPVAFSADGSHVFLATEPKGAEICDVRTGKALPLEKAPKVFSPAAFSNDGSHVAVSLGQDTLSVWDTASRKPIWRKKGKDPYGLVSLVFSPDGHFLLAGNFKNLRVFEVATGEVVSVLDTPADALAFLPGGTSFLIGRQAGLWLAHLNF